MVCVNSCILYLQSSPVTVCFPVRYEKNYFTLAAFNYPVKSVGEEFEGMF